MSASAVSASKQTSLIIPSSSESPNVLTYLWSLVPNIFSSSAKPVSSSLQDKEFVLVTKEPLIEVPGLSSEQLLRVLQYVEHQIGSQTIARQREIAQDYAKYLSNLPKTMGGTELSTYVEIFAKFIAEKIRDDKEILTRLLESLKTNSKMESNLPIGLSMDDFIRFSKEVSEKAIKLGKTGKEDILDIIDQIESERSEGQSIDPKLKIYIGFIRRTMSGEESPIDRRKVFRPEGKRSPTSSINLQNTRTSDSSDDTSSKSSLDEDDIFTVIIMDLLTKEERSFNTDKEEAEKLKDLKPSSFSGAFLASLLPIRTNNCESLSADLFFPITTNFATTINDPVAKAFACIFAFIWDLMTFAFRLLLLIPRLIFNACKPEHPLTMIFREHGLPKGFGSESVKITVNVNQEDKVTLHGNLVGERYINLVSIPSGIEIASLIKA